MHRYGRFRTRAGQVLRPPTNARAHYLRGQVLLASGRLEEAASALERARVFDPDAPQIVQALSDVSLNLGDTASARQFLATGTQIAPDDATIWAQYGRLELAFGDRTVGRAALERALALGADWPFVQRSSAMISAKANRRRCWSTGRSVGLRSSDGAAIFAWPRGMPQAP